MSIFFDINLYFEKYLNDFFEKTNYNDLKKSVKYQIRLGDSNNVTYGVFVGYNKELNHAIFNVKNNDVLTQVSHRPIYTFYRLISIEEHDAKIKPFKMFQKLYKITTGEKYKIIYGIAYTGLVTRKLCFGDGSYSIEHLVFYNNEWVLMKYFNTSKIPIEYYSFVSEKEYRKKLRDKFNENALKTILNRLIDGFQW
jgi:hypothetical protein